MYDSIDGLKAGVLKDVDTTATDSTIPGKWCGNYKLDDWGECTNLFNGEIETCKGNCLLRLR
jgi:hypothetical protein